jgi:imidazolonepropionase-like amidohydrolase
MTTTASPRRTLTALRAAWLYDGTSATLVPDPIVVLDGGTILAVESGGVPPAGAAVVDLPGATLLPGLVDTHVHLAFDAGDDPVGALAARDDRAALAAMTEAGRAAARGGVTTVRDLGDRGYLGLTLRATGDPTLPTIVAAGPPITTPGGHCHYLGAPASGVDGVRAAVREHAERGVDVIKIMASGGNLTPGTRPELPQFGVPELRAAVDEAHRYSLPVTAHAHGTRAVAQAIESGVDGMEHVSFLTRDGVDPAPDEVVAAIADRRVTLGLTLGIAPVPGATVPPGMAERMPALTANARRLYESGARITAGTDAGIGRVKPHDVLRWAVAHLGRIGMSPVEALRASTSVAAAVCGLGHRKGRLEPGYDADVLAVDGDPLTDPAALHRVVGVYIRGARIPATAAIR